MGKVFRANLYFLIVLILEVVAPIFLGVIYLILGIEDVRVILLGNHIVLFLVPAIIYLVTTKSSVKDTLKLNKIYFKDILLIIMLAFVCQPIMSFFSLITSFFFNNEVGVFISEIGSTPYLVMLSLVALLPAITEEVTIRGIVLSGYKNKNKYLAAAITGLFFGILHLDPQQFLYATVLGFILALLVRITNSIFSACILHFIINGISVTASKILSSSQSIVAGGAESIDLSLISLPISEKFALFIMYGIIALIFSVFVYIIIKKLDDINRRRGIVDGTEEEGYRDYNSNDKILNIPFACIILVYILAIFIMK